MYRKILQKTLVVMTYNHLKEQIITLEDVRREEKKYLLNRQDLDDRYDERISQRSISLALKGENNPNWLNDIFRESKDINLSNYLRIVAYIKEKYSQLWIEDDFHLEDFVSDRSLEMGALLNRYRAESQEKDFCLEEFFQDFSDELIDEVSEILGSFLLESKLTEEKTSSIIRILDAITIDYSERESIENYEGDEENDI